MCNLKENEYYSTQNDEKAKAVLPLYFTNPINVYSFEKISNVYTKQMSITLLGLESDVAVS